MALRPRHGTTKKARRMSQEEWDEAIRVSHRGLRVLTAMGYVLLVLWIVALLYRFTPLRDVVAKIGLAMPWLIFAFGFMHRGTIKFDAPRGADYPTIVSTIVPVFPVLCGAVFQQTFLSLASIWKPAVLTSILIALCIILVDPQAISFSTFGERAKTLTKRLLNVFALLSLGFILSFGWVIEANVAFDQSAVSWHSTTLQDKHISRGKYTSFILSVARWDAKDETYDLDVSAANYHKFEIGTPIRLGVKEGFLGIPWMADIAAEP